MPLLTGKIPWQTFFWLYALAVIYVTQKPLRGSSPTWLPDLFIEVDKIVHFLLFATMAFLMAYAQKRFDFWIFIYTFGFSFLIEVLQYLLPFGRSFDLFDLLANGLGAACGLMLARTPILRKNL